MPKRSLFAFALLSLLAPFCANPERAEAASIQIITTFDYPKAGTEDTGAAGIANNGNLVGNFTFAPNGVYAGFERTFHGRFSGPIRFPASGVDGTSAAQINTSDLVCGTFHTTNYHGYFYDGISYTQFDYPGSTLTYLFDLNDAGDFVGQFGLPLQSFASIGGNLSTIAIAGAQFTSATGINNLNQITGAYGGPTGYHGFVLDSDGTLIAPLDFPGAPNTFPRHLNDKGVVVGSWIDSTGTGHGFILRLPGQFIGYDYPGAAETDLGGINNAGVITGSYRDSSDHYHAFMAQLVP